MTNTLVEKMYLSKTARKQSVFKIDSKGVLHGFSPEFFDFVNKQTALQDQEYKQIRELFEKTEKLNLSEFSESTEEQLNEQLQSINQTNMEHTYLRYKQMLEEMEEKFSDSESILIDFNNKYLKTYAMRFLGFKCDIHLENPELKIKKVDQFPSFDMKKRTNNYHLPNSQSDIKTHMTTDQLLATTLTDLTLPASWIELSDNPTPERFSQALNHWGTQITNYFNRFVAEEQKLVEEKLFRRLENHPFKLFFLYDTTKKTGARIMFICKKHREAKYGIQLLTYCQNNLELEDIVRKNIAEDIPFEVCHQTSKTAK